MAKGSGILPINMCDDAKNDARLNVLYSPFRKREVNPQDWESKMSYWKNKIMNLCLTNNSCIFTLADLHSVFLRNGRPPSCLATVLDDMLRNAEITRLQDLLNKSPLNESWSSWAVNSLVKSPIIWSFTKLKESIVPKSEYALDEKYVHLAVLKKHSKVLRNSCTNKSQKSIITIEEIKSKLNLRGDLDVKVALHWLQLQGQAAVTTINNKTIVKVSTPDEKVTSFSDADIGIFRLQQNEQDLKQMLEQLESEKQSTEQEARNYLKTGMRHVAKSCLRKKKELEKCIDKRASALENVQVLLSRVKEAESNGEILESYKIGLSALKATFKDAGLSEDSVGQTMDQVREVLEVHEEIENALSEPIAASVEKDLEDELAELLAQDNTIKQLDSLPDLPEPPSQSPTSSSIRSTARVTQALME